MAVDPEKLRELADTLSEDQKRLLREGLASGENLDPDSLIATLSSSENQEVLRDLAVDIQAVPAADARAGDAGVGDAGAGDAGAPPPVPEAPLTRW